jgi:hypothetical protein
MSRLSLFGLALGVIVLGFMAIPTAKVPAYSQYNEWKEPCPKCLFEVQHADPVPGT